MQYYKKKYVIYEILKNCTNRDFSALSNNKANIRGLKVSCIFDFDRVLKLMNWEKNKQNLYRSVATLKCLPKFTFNPKLRKSETSVWYKEHYSEDVTDYDLLFDFDSNERDWKGLLDNVKALKEYLDDYIVPYYIIFSGNKGFQLVIPGEYLKIENIEKGNVFPHKSIAEIIKQRINLPLLDLANNGVNNRLCKIPYSLVLGGCKKELNEEEIKDYNENDMTIALPLSDEQLKIFSFEKMKLKNVINGIPLIRRGNLERFSDLSLEQKRKNIQNFIKIFNFK